MNWWSEDLRPAALTCLISLILLLVACAEPAGHCPPYQPVSLAEAATFAGDNSLPFRFPLDKIAGGKASRYTNFAAYGGLISEREYHAAEDYAQPAGTPVYAITGGEVTFSGPMGGYGWLVIVDHPQANLYSLYGHLSPSRWQIEPGPVEKGELLGYLGDDDENGGSADQPLRPHLHLGIRAGQRADYPTKGEWRWQAGWIKPCPQDLGWLQPSLIITGQQILPGGFQAPAGGLLEKWGMELFLAGIYLTGGVCVLIYALRRDKPLVLIVYGLLLTVAGLLVNNRGSNLSLMLLAMAVLFLALGLYKIIRQSRKTNTPAP
jgi:murein DD-endopeptidase MepM/ murein hydrolase activator NlpD